MKDTIVAGLKSRFKCPSDEKFDISALHTASFLYPRYKSPNFIRDVEIQAKIKQYVLYLMRAEEVFAGAIPTTESPQKKRKTVCSYLEGDFSENKEDDPEDEIQKYQ